MNRFCGFADFNRNYIREELLMNTICEKILPKSHIYIGEHTVFLSERGLNNLKRTVSGYEFSITGGCKLKNYDELKLSLIKYGYSFSDASDKEVILYAYIHYGESCVTHLEGEMSFAIWDSMRQRVFIYHNVSEEQPLFYAVMGKAIIFSNDLFAINNYPDMKFKISKKGFSQLTLMGDEIFTNLFTIKSGQYMIINRCGFVVKPVFESVKRMHTLSKKCYEIMGDLLLDSIKNTLDTEHNFDNLAIRSDIISSIVLDKSRPYSEALSDILDNPCAPLFALFDKEKIRILLKESLTPDEWLIEYLLKINYLFENYNVRMV